MITYGVIIMVSAIISGLNFFVLPIVIGIIAQAFTVSPAGYGFIHFVDRVLDFFERVREMRILIVDDEPATGLFLQSIIKELPGVKTDIATSGKEALKKALISQPQAVFLDIDMPDINGIELAHTLAEKYEDLSLVFATAHPDHALEAFELYSIDYILKPFDQERIKRTVKKLMDKSKYFSSTEVPIPVKTTIQNMFLKPSNILYIEARNSGNIIQTSNGTHITKEKYP